MQGERKSDWRRGAVALALIIPLAGCAGADDRQTQLDWPLARDTDHPGATYYTVHVRPGDTLSELAQRYGVPANTVASMNGIVNRNSIHAGQTLRIPAGSRGTRDAVYADATSRPTWSNPYIAAPEPRRGGYPQTTGAVTVGDLPVIGPRSTTPPRWVRGSSPAMQTATDAPLKPVVVGNNTPKPVVVASNTPKPRSTTNAPAWYTPSTPAPVQQTSKPVVQPTQQSQTPSQQTQPVVQVVQQQQSVPASSRFVWPVSGRVISQFGSTAGGERNDGINVAARAGDPIRAAASGTVTYAGNQLRGYGNLLLIKHDDGFVTAYAHAQSILVQKGDRVLKGQVIGAVGQTGDVTEPQLHFEIRNGVRPVNPMALLVASR